MSAPIKRSIDPDRFPAMVRDTAFLVDRIRSERGELDLRLRNNYFNLYYKGNSMAKVFVLPDGGGYEVSVHQKFTEDADSAVNRDELTGYDVRKVGAPDLRRVLSKQNIDRMASRIKHVNWGEEVTFEQMLITDNPPRPDFFIIDRQVTGGALGRSRLDLLALRRVSAVAEDVYRFVVLEVKLGNNPELVREVLTQLRGYVRTIDDDLVGFSQCYEETYRQMLEMTLLPAGMLPEIHIVGPVEGLVVVGGYSGMAADAIKKMRQVHTTQPDPTDKRIFLWRNPSVLTEHCEPL